MAEMMDEKLRRRAEEDALAADVIEECRVHLMLKFRFLDLALWRMDLTPVRAGAAYPLATNGHIVAMDPPRVLGRFRQSMDESVRDYLHMVLHCIFRHPYDRDHKDREAWSLTCDVIVESVAMDLCAGRFPSAEDAARKEALDTMRLLAGALLPGKVYALVHGLVETPDGQQYRGLGRSTLNEWHALFERDEHAAWPAMADGNDKGDNGMPDGYAPEEAPEGDAEGDAASSLDDTLDARQMPQSMREQMPHDVDADAEAADTDAGTGTDGGGEDDAQAAQDDQPRHEQHGSDPLGRFHGTPDRDDADDDANDDDDVNADNANAQRDWEDISKQIQMNLSTFSREWGNEASAFMQNLAVANRPRYDYADLLRQFMVRNEQMLVNPDEFDYVYYTYGMELYGNMPLVEPLEYKDTERIRDLVIAIDTSESVSGDLVRRFVQHTFDILKGADDFARDVNIHVVQCDSRLQQDTVIRDLADVDALMEGFTVRGFGGTDFRPVFDYVRGMREDGKLADLRGLIYFTDGLGTFPDAAPDFDAAFVFLEDEARETPPVPPWAIKLMIDETSLERVRP